MTGWLTIFFMGLVQPPTSWSFIPNLGGVINCWIYLAVPTAACEGLMAWRYMNGLAVDETGTDPWGNHQPSIGRQINHQLKINRLS